MLGNRRRNGESESVDPAQPPSRSFSSFLRAYHADENTNNAPKLTTPNTPNATNE